MTGPTNRGISRVVRYFAILYLALLLGLAGASFAPWTAAPPGDAIRPLQWIATSTRYQLLDVAIASCLSLGIGLFTSVGALRRNVSVPPLGRVQQVAFALPFLVFLAVWRTRMGSSGSRFDVSLVAGVSHGLTLGRSLCEGVLATGTLGLQDDPEESPSYLSFVLRQQSNTLRLTAARFALTCIALDALTARLGFGRIETQTWGDLLGAAPRTAFPSSSTLFAVFGTLGLPWALFTVCSPAAVPSPQAK